MSRRSSTGQQGSGKKGGKAKGQADSVEHHEIDDDLFMLGGGGEGGGRGERRTSSRVVGGQSSGGTDQDAIALAKSLYHGPQKNQKVLNVEGRGSCTVFALGASIGLNVKHVVESGDSLGNEITTVHANDRVIDLLFRSGAKQTLYDHYQGRQIVQHPRCIQWFTDQLVHPMGRMSTRTTNGQWLECEWLSIMAANAGLRWLYIINVDEKTIVVYRITFSGDDDENIKKIKCASYSWDEWTDRESISDARQHLIAFKQNHDAIHSEPDELARLFSVLISKGKSNQDMHYYAVRPRKDRDVPFVRMLDENSRGKRLFDTVCAMQGEQEADLGRRIGEYCGAQRKNAQQAAARLTWRKVAEDAEREDELDSDDMREDEPDKADASNPEKPGDGLKPVVFHTRVFATRVNHEDVIDKKGAVEVDDKLNTELCPHFVTAPYATTFFAELPKLAQWAAESLGWSASTWDSNSFTPKLDFSGAGAEKMPPEIRELIKLLHPELAEDQDSLTHSYIIKRILGYSPLTWPGPTVKFGDFEEDVVMICEVIERIWLISARNSSDLLPGLADDGDEADLNKIAVEFKDGKRLYFETTNFYSEIVDKILFKEGARRRPLQLTNEKDFLEWARNLAAIVVKEVQEVHHGEEQEVDADDEADLRRWGSERVHETITNKGKTVKRLGLRHIEQHNAIRSVLRDQEAIASLMLVDDNDFVVWMTSGAKFKVPSSQINGIFTKLFRDKLRSMPNKKFKVPIGHRSPSMTKLPQSFDALPTSLVSTKTSKECVGSAIALGLHAFGDLQNVALVKQHAALAVTAVEAGRFLNELDYFKWFFQQYCPRLYMINAKSMLTCNSLYTLARGSPQAILIINPIASDGNCGHALCVHNNFIYDSAEERAMPLEQQWLDRCVRVDARDSATFACVKEVLILQPTSRLLKGVKRLLNQSDGQHKKTKI